MDLDSVFNSGFCLHFYEPEMTFADPLRAKLINSVIFPSNAIHEANIVLIADV